MQVIVRRKCNVFKCVIIHLFNVTGNCIPPSGPVTCFNLTLFSTDDELMVKISSCPFDAYVPVPFEDQLATDFENISENRYTYCKSKLQEMVTKLRVRKKRVTFHFHLGDCLDLCLRNEEMKEKFQVVHCTSTLLHQIGLANVPSCRNVLASSDSVLLTNFNLPYVERRWKFSALEYIETCLCCPLSLIPTLYGVKLTNHLLLGSPYPIQLHDKIEKNELITLKWQQSPGYSKNISLVISPILETAIKRLAAARFNSEYEFCCGHPLYTYHFILQSLSSRCTLLERDILHSDRFLADVNSVFRLLWQTEKAWMKGEEVVRYSLSRIRSETAELPPTIYNFMAVPSSVPPGVYLKQEYINWIGSCQQKIGNTTVTRHIATMQIDDLKDPSLSVLLEKNHQPRNLTLFITKAKGTSIPITAEFRDLRSEVTSNRYPFKLQSAVPQPELAVGLRVLKCSEVTDSYQLEISVDGVKINDAKGNASFF